MKKITLLFSALTLMASTLQAQTPIVFDFDTNAIDTFDPVNNPNYVTETIEGIQLECTDLSSGTSGTSLPNLDGYYGASGLAVQFSGYELVEFTFSEPVVVNSILALDGAAISPTYTFTPTGGEGNEPVTVTLDGGGATAMLNWINVTSFTVSSTGSIMQFDNLSVYPSNTPTVFGFEPVSNGGNAAQSADTEYVTETVDGITVSGTDLIDGGATLLDIDGWYGAVGYAISFSNFEVEFTFSEPVVVNSVLALDGAAISPTYVFIPTGGEGNEPVTVTLDGGGAVANLNWIGVTSFTVATGGAIMQFDNLSVQSMQSSGTLSIDTPSPREQVKVYPNPVQNTLHIKNSTEIQSVTIYSITGQQVYTGSNTSSIDVSNLSEGMYLLKLKTTQGTEVVKRIIKN